MSGRTGGDDAHSASARRVILLVLFVLVVGLVVVALTTSTRSPATGSDPAITASPVPVGDQTVGADPAGR